MSASITVLSTGGTIASTQAEDGATPSRSGGDLIAAVPELGSYADIAVTEVVQTPSFDMDIESLAVIVEQTRTAVDDGADGVVITHGTDTMAESAYYLDLVLDLDAPVVLTGAQRRSDEVSPDGPSNLLTAARAASHDRFRDRGGVYIAFDEELHAARDVTKAHTSDLSAFVSPDKSPVAHFTRESVRVHREPGSRSDTIEATTTSADVVVVKTGIGVGTQQVDAALGGSVDGLIVEGTGLGNTTSPLGGAIRDALEADVPVVITSRCQGGAVAPVYGTPGGGKTLRSHGIIDGGDLPAHKARLKLMLLIEEYEAADLTTLREAFEANS
ncbi:asparaginase [Halococcus salifodinae]|uniref:L-asparaginase n=1 Tax=Halococcus salifodinae DSM 8989 TaxID=1227456 RepID=M0MZE1_9EURY|nr:asparaginase [Halococcus salifodinae]EMA49790.1 asparaginase [Halococcus salifodinae DSM 8989]